MIPWQKQKIVRIQYNVHLTWIPECVSLNSALDNRDLENGILKH
jgi:hypothetical protein